MADGWMTSTPAAPAAPPLPTGRATSLTPLQRHVLERVASGQKSADDIAHALHAPKADAVKTLDDMVGAGLLGTRKEKFVFTTYVLTDAGVQALGAPKAQIELLRESAMVKVGAYAKLTLTVKNTGAALLENARVQVNAPKNFTLLRSGSTVTETGDERRCTAPLPYLAAGENVTLIFHFTAVLPSGVASNKYALRAQLDAQDGRALDRKETSVYVEAAESLLGGGSAGFTRLPQSQFKPAPGVI